MRLWIDAHHYGATLLRGKEEPWLQPEAVGMFCADLARLLSPDRLLLPIAPLILPQLTSAEGDAQRRAADFGNAIDAGRIETHLCIAMAAIQQTSIADSVVPFLPGASLIAGDMDDEDALDEIISYLGDILRTLAALRPIAIMMEEPNERALDLASSLFRIAAHLGLTLVPLGTRYHPATALCFPASADAGAAGKGDTQSLGDILGAAPQNILTGTHDIYLTIDPNASPEQVLARLSALRSGVVSS